MQEITAPMEFQVQALGKIKGWHTAYGPVNAEYQARSAMAEFERQFPHVRYRLLARPVMDWADITEA
jgi:hypothetical protein